MDVQATLRGHRSLQADAAKRESCTPSRSSRVAGRADPCGERAGARDSRRSLSRQKSGWSASISLDSAGEEEASLARRRSAPTTSMSSRYVSDLALETMNVAAELRRSIPACSAKMLGPPGASRTPRTRCKTPSSVRSWLGSWEPDSTEAWLLTVATKLPRDRLRRSQRDGRHADALTVLAEMAWVQGAIPRQSLRTAGKTTYCACCSRAESRARNGESAALSLRRCSAYQLTKSRKRSASQRARWTAAHARAAPAARKRRPGGASPENAGERLDAVLAVIHLLFNEGTGRSTTTRQSAVTCAVGDWSGTLATRDISVGAGGARFCSR